MVSTVPNKASEINDAASERTVIEEGADNAHTAGTSETPTMVASISSASINGKEQDDDEGSNLIGKINNLMSTVRLSFAF